MNEQYEKQSKTLALVRASDEVEFIVPLLFSLPGAIKDFNEPELLLIEIRADALKDEICINAAVSLETFYVDEVTGLVENEMVIQNITHIIAAKGIMPGQTVEAEGEVVSKGSWTTELQAVSGKTLFSGECKVMIQYSVLAEKELTFFKPAGIDGETLMETVDVEAIQAHFKQTFDLSIPIELNTVPMNLGKTSGYAANIKASVLCGWVKAEGEVVVTLPYQVTADLLCNEMYVFPVKKYLQVSEAKTGMDVDICGQVNILACRWQPKERTCLVRGLLSLEGKLINVEPLQIAVSDGNSKFTAYSFKPDHFEMEEVVSFGSSQTLIEREIIFDRPVRKVRDPVSARVRNLRYELIPNKVIVRGILHKDLYAVDASSGTVFLHEVKERFVHFVDVPGASPGMRAYVNARVEYVQVDVNPDRESARQVAIIEIKAKVKRFIKKNIVIKPPHSSIGTDPVSSGRIYVVRSGDSIWKIARMFGVTMESVIAANKLQNPDLIFPGQKLIIPR